MFVHKFIVAALAIASPTSAFVASPTPFTSRSLKSTSSNLKMSAELTLSPEDTACVFIEFQNEFTSEGGKLHEAVKPCLDKFDTIGNGVKILEAARAAGCTILHVPIEFEKGHNEISSQPYGILAGVKEGEAFAANEWNSKICDAMTPADGEIVIKGKTGLCGFKSTNLDFILRQRGVKNVVLCGFLTNCCVESTMRSAYENGYKVYTVKDACAATSVEAHEATMEHNFGMFSVPSVTEEVVSALKVLVTG